MKQPREVQVTSPPSSTDALANFRQALHSGDPSEIEKCGRRLANARGDDDKSDNDTFLDQPIATVRQLAPEDHPLHDLLSAYRHLAILVAESPASREYIETIAERAVTATRENPATEALLKRLRGAVRWRDDEAVTALALRLATVRDRGNTALAFTATQMAGRTGVVVYAPDSVQQTKAAKANAAVGPAGAGRVSGAANRLCPPLPLTVPRSSSTGPSSGSSR